MAHPWRQNLEQSSSFRCVSPRWWASWQCEGPAQPASVPAKCTNSSAHVFDCLSVIDMCSSFSGCCYLALNLTYVLVWLRKGRVLAFRFCLLCSRHVGGGCAFVTKWCLTLGTPWTAAHQAPLSMGFPRQEYCGGLLFLSPGDLPNPGIKPTSPALASGFLTTEPPGNLWSTIRNNKIQESVLQ